MNRRYRAIRRRADRVLYLHCLNRQKRSPCRYLCAVGNMNRNHNPRHPGKQRSGIGRTRPGRGQRIVDFQRETVVADKDEKVPVLAQDDAGYRAAIGNCVERFVRGPVAGDGNSCPIEGQRAGPKGEIETILTVQDCDPPYRRIPHPPAVTAGPWRCIETVGRPRQFGERRQGYYFLRHRADRRRQAVDMPGDKPGVESARAKFRMIDNRLQEMFVGFRAGDPDFRQRVEKSPASGVAIRGPHDYLGDHRVVVNRHLVALLHAGIDAHIVGLIRQPKVRQGAEPRREIIRRIFGIEPRFDRMAGAANILLCQRQSFARCDAELPVDQVDAGDHLGHRMFDLKTRVHFHEPDIPAGSEQEFDRSRAGIAHGLRRGDGSRVKTGANFVAQTRRWRLFDHLLVAALGRTVALEQMDRIAVVVAEDLDFDMARVFKIFFNQQRVVAKRRQRLAPGRRQSFRKLACRPDDPHPAPAATGRRFDHHRIAGRDGRRRQRGIGLVGIRAAGQHRHPCRRHNALGLGLRAHGPDRRRRRADKHDTGRRARLCEFGIFRQKPVTGMNCLRPGCLCRRNDGIDIEIAFR